jgi:hypothetical protein
MARDDFESIIGLLGSSEAQGVSHSALEELLSARGRELMRKLLQAHIDSRGPGEAACAVQGADGVERDRPRIHERELGSMFGGVDVKRLGYRADGVDSLHPLDAELNLPVESASAPPSPRALSVARLEVEVGNQPPIAHEERAALFEAPEECGARGRPTRRGTSAVG